MILEAMSRAVWRNDRKVANKIINVSSFAAQHIGIFNGRVLPVNFQVFQDLYAGMKLKYSSVNART